MSLPTSRHAYKDCIEVYDKALADDQGARVKVPDHDAAVFFRMRMNNIRKILREESQKIYEKDDPKYGITPYDPLTVRIKNLNGEFYIYVEHQGLDLGETESLSEVE